MNNRKAKSNLRKFRVYLISRIHAKFTTFAKMCTLTITLLSGALGSDSFELLVSFYSFV